MREVMLVARREYLEKGLKKSMVISTVVIIAVIMLAGLAGRIWLAPKLAINEQATVVLAEEVSDYAEDLAALTAGGDSQYQVVAVPESDVRDLVVDGELPDGVTPEQAPNTAEKQAEYAVVAGVVPNERGGVDILSSGDLDPADARILMGAAQSYVTTKAVRALGADPAQFQAEIIQAMPQVIDVDQDSASEEGGFFSDEEFSGPQYLMGIITITLILMSTLMGAQLVMSGVVEEKTSRVVEVLLATIHPAKLLAGKVIGIGALVLTQIALLVAAAGLGLMTSGLVSEISLPLSSSLAWMMLWFVVGYVLNAVLFGSAASLVSRQEEIGAITFPLMLLTMVPFYMAMYMVPMAPESTATKISSLIPFISAFMMPMRVAFESVQIWELLVALGLSLLALPLLIWVGGRVYQRAVLHTGGRMKLKDALFG